MRRDFFEQHDSRYIKSARAALQSELIKLTDEVGPNEAFIVPTLEDICLTYRNAVMNHENTLIEKVRSYRKLSILPERIHRFFCEQKECPYIDPEKGKSVAGLSMLSFNAFLIRSQHGPEANGELIGNPKKLYFDEADSFLHAEKVKFQDSDIFNKLISPKKLVLLEDNNFIKVTHVQDFDLLRTFKKEHNAKSRTEHDVERWKRRLWDLSNAVKVLDFGYITGYDTTEMTVTMVPRIVPVFKYVLDKGIQMVCSSATLRMDLIQRERINQYFSVIRDSVAEDLKDRVKFLNQMDFEAGMERVGEIYSGDIGFVKSPPPQGETQLYLYSVRDHSFSANRYNYRYDKTLNPIESASKNEKFLKKRFTEVEQNVEKALEYMRLVHGLDMRNKKVLVIAFKEIVAYIIHRKEEANYHKERSILFGYDYMSWFSNSMHGFNAPDCGYELIILYGDPVSKHISQFCQKLDLFPKERQRLRRGFVLREGVDPFFRRLVTPSSLSELFEGIHRTRNNIIPPETLEIHPKIPVLAISNLLDPDNDLDKEIVNSLLKEDNIKLHHLNERGEEFKKAKRKEVKAEIKSLLSDFEIDFRDQNKDPSMKP